MGFSSGVDLMSISDRKVEDTEASKRSNIKSLLDRTSDEHRRRHEDDYYCSKDLEKQIVTRCSLLPGCFYYEDADSSQAKALLKLEAVGTFLIRDSSDPKFLYTISVKTKRGPTSIRICYGHGVFSLDSDEQSKCHMPKFQTLLELVDFYIRKSRGKKSEQCRFLDKTGKKDLPIVMLKPKKHSVPSLMHLTRTVVNKALSEFHPKDLTSAVDRLPLPNPLKSYLNEYPYLF